MERLLESGANPNARDEDGWTPLHSAAAANNTQTPIDCTLTANRETIDRLAAAGGDPNARGAWRNQPIPDLQTVQRPSTAHEAGARTARADSDLRITSISP